jgi:hypothetical protein
VPDAYNRPSDRYKYERYRPLGQDHGPYAISQVRRDVVNNEVMSRMTVESVGGIQPRLWFDEAASTLKYPYHVTVLDGSFESYSGSYSFSNDKLYHFASAFPSSVDTGALRYHATRLNSSISCTTIDNTTFPETCSGSRPFVGDYTLGGGSNGNARVRWCVPGAYDVSPWTLSRNRQDITEEMYIDVVETIPKSSSDFYVTNAMHCIANTTRGPFELPNAFNQHKPGPLLDNWPSQQEIAASYNDRDRNDNAPSEM